MSHLKMPSDAYWRVKQGSKSDTAWNRLMNNLLKFLDKYGKEVVEEQLGKAESGKWKGIELSELREHAARQEGHRARAQAPCLP